MRQQINLYKTLPTPSRYVLNEKWTIIIVSIFALILIAISLFQFMELQYKSYELKRLQAALVKQTQKLNTLISKTQSQQIAAIKQEIALKTSIINMLHPASHTICNFSEYFTALAQARTPGIWLTSIEIVIDKPQMSLAGMTVEPALVMSWLKNLATTPCFIHQPFSTIELSKPILQNKIKVMEFTVAADTLYQKPGAK